MSRLRSMVDEGEVEVNAPCEFKRFCTPALWCSYEPGPVRGSLSRGLHPVHRCPLCNNRFKMKAHYNYGSGEEFVCWVIPDHSPRVFQNKSLKRKTVKSRRGS